MINNIKFLRIEEAKEELNLLKPIFYKYSHNIFSHDEKLKDYIDDIFNLKTNALNSIDNNYLEQILNLFIHVRYKIKYKIDKLNYFNELNIIDSKYITPEEMEISLNNYKIMASRINHIITNIKRKLQKENNYKKIIKTKYYLKNREKYKNEALERYYEYYRNGIKLNTKRGRKPKNNINENDKNDKINKD